MTNHEREKEEYMERLWCMKEAKLNLKTDLQRMVNGGVNETLIDEMVHEELIKLEKNGKKIFLTKKGISSAQLIIRSHRIAERLIYDILGDEFESGACEFEHIITPEIVNSICILLGHPRECPHGMRIPKGECCLSSARTVESRVSPLVELKIGQSARIAYVNCRTDQQHHKLDGLQIRPNMFVKMHQTYPSYVIECNSEYIALDKEITSNIFVWNKP